MKKNILLFFLTFLLLMHFCEAQKKSKGSIGDEPVAKIGAEVITSDEFKTRYELLPHPSVTHKDADSLKKEFLASLIAEKLWALEAKEMHFDTLKLYQNLLKPIEKMFLRDALFKQEVDSKIKISDIDLVRAKARAQITLKVLIIGSVDSSESYEIYNQLKKGVAFDSLLKMRPDYTLQKEPVPITFGKMDDEWMEDSLYRMKPTTFSKPMKNKNGWFIFKIVDKITGTPDKAPSLAGNVKNIIRARRSKQFGTEFLNKLLSGIQVPFNANVVTGLPDKMLESFQKRRQINPADSANLHFTEFDLGYIASTYGDEFLAKPIALFETDPPTLNDFLYYLLVEDFSVKRATKQNIVGLLQKKLNEFVQHELITREALKRGLQNLPDVKKDLQMWRDNYLSQFMKRVFVDSSRVSDDQAYQYYLQKTGNQVAGVKVNLVEIFSDNLDSVQIILKKINEGNDFKILAEKYNRRKSTQSQKGEFGWQYTFQLGEIGKVAESMKEGEVYGPLKVEGGYSIFKLLGKKEAQDSVKQTFQATKDQVKEELFTKRLYENVNEGTARFAQKFGVSLYDQTLKQLSVTEVNMFVYRFIGFGGRITGVPYTTPNFEWLKTWQKQKNFLP
ncbi:MAG: peptidylprolyl isomerase [Ignavibacteriaceae bacterium]|nr:peptidylprolyl isomerase [Ignavibacteriaceae bacterium]